MAKAQTISQLFLAADYAIRFAIYDRLEQQMVDVSGMALSFMLKKTLGQPDSLALLTKTLATGLSVTGTFDTNPVINTQRVEVRITATETKIFGPRVAAFELKRMDPGFETPLSYGPATLSRGVHRT